MIRTIASLFLGVLLVACSKDKPSGGNASRMGALGDPIGAEIQASAKAPAMSIALAITKGQDPVPMLPKLVSAVAQSAAQCPAFVAEAKEPATDVVAVDFTVEQGKLKPLPRPASEATAGRTCLGTQLEGKELAAADTPKLEGRAEIKLNK